MITAAARRGLRQGRWRFAITFLVTSLLASCGGGSSQTSAEENPSAPNPSAQSAPQEQAFAPQNPEKQAPEKQVAEEQAAEEKQAPASTPLQPGTGSTKSTDNPPSQAPAHKRNTSKLKEIAERFVKLVLGVGVHDDDYVDAYLGPQQWRDEIETRKPSLGALHQEATALLGAISKLDAAHQPRRTAMLKANIRAALTRIEMAQGKKFLFDQETKLLYGVVAPLYSIEEFENARREVERLLPGDLPLNERVNNFRHALAIPPEKLHAVFNAAITECRRRTKAHYTLPDKERFTLNYVEDKPWSGYNWYKGDFESLIEINTDLPIIIDRAIDLGCHEGYPGHHMWNIFIERDLLGEKGWVEYSVYPLFSPLALIAEGSANFGIDLAFPGEEKTIFERDVLFPLAGLDPDKAKALATLNQAMRKLSHARNYIIRDYLDGDINREKATQRIMRYGLTSRVRAEKSLDFAERYRGYILNYNLGRDIVRDYIESQTAQGIDPWVAFQELLSAPRPPIELAP